MAKKGKIIASVIGGLIVLGAIGNALPKSEQGNDSVQSMVQSQSSKSCKEERISPKETKTDTDKLAKGVTVTVKEGASGTTKVCLEGDKIISRDTTKEPSDTVTLVGTATLPSGYDGKYDVSSIKNEYVAHGSLQSNFYGTYTAPQPATNYNQPKASTPPQNTTQTTYYANCSEARAAGVTPIYRGQPGYSTKLDRDKDGIACE